MTLGPVMVDVNGLGLNADDRTLLAQSAVGGVILFARNFQSPDQVAELIADIHAVRSPPLLVAVDQEGGRVQRLRDGFTLLPPARQIGHQYDADPAAARRQARLCGWLMAAELRAVGIDLSFAPVVDLDRGLSEVIGDRAFHDNAQAVGDLAQSWVAGMRDAGMAATAKHFPGHGAVAADSHHRLPVDRRRYADIADDIEPFARLIRAELGGVMMAHIVYEQVDLVPASFSSRWIGDELRGRMGFRGVVFSDDLCMAGAAGIGPVPVRARTALAAGCDMVLVCNDRPAAEAVVAHLDGISDPVSQSRLPRMRGRGAPDRNTLLASARWLEVRQVLAHMNDRPDLTLDA